MPWIQIKLQDKIDNVSFQVGDTVYAIEPNDMDTVKNFNTSSTIREIGIVELILHNQNISVWSNGTYIPSNSSYIMFGKNTHANNTSLLGYYLQADFVNSSTREASLFSVSSEITSSGAPSTSS
jgi:hypothetical protein